MTCPFDEQPPAPWFLRTPIVAFGPAADNLQSFFYGVYDCDGFWPARLWHGLGHADVIDVDATGAIRNGEQPSPIGTGFLRSPTPIDSFLTLARFTPVKLFSGIFHWVQVAEFTRAGSNAMATLPVHANCRPATNLILPHTGQPTQEPALS